MVLVFLHFCCVYRYGKENKLPSPAEKRHYNGVVKKAQEEIIRSGHYHIGKEKNNPTGKLYCAS